MKAKTTVEIINVTKNKRSPKFIVDTTIGQFKFSDDTIVNNLVLKGKTFTLEEFEKIQEFEKRTEVFNKVLNYISYQMRSEFEIKQYLSEKNVEADDIEKILDKIKSFGYVNDYELAKSAFDSSVKRKKGPKFLERKLIEKHISKDIIKEILGKYNFNLELELAKDVANKVAEKKISEPVKKQKQLVFNKLSYDGFSNEVINIALSDLNFIDNSEQKLENECKKLLYKYRSEESNKKNNKIIASLLRKGFEYSDILKKINE